MNLHITKSQLESAFASPRKTLRRGTILVPAAPVNLDKAAETAIETEEDQAEFDNAGPGVVYEQLGWEREPLLRFYWQSLGPMVCECHLDILHTDDDFAIACVTQDAGPRLQAFAGIKHPSDPTVMRAFFAALIRNNVAPP